MIFRLARSYWPLSKNEVSTIARPVIFASNWDSYTSSVLNVPAGTHYTGLSAGYSDRAWMASRQHSAPSVAGIASPVRWYGMYSNPTRSSPLILPSSVSYAAINWAGSVLCTLCQNKISFSSSGASRNWLSAGACFAPYFSIKDILFRSSSSLSSLSTKSTVMFEGYLIIFDEASSNSTSSGCWPSI